MRKSSPKLFALTIVLLSISIARAADYSPIKTGLTWRYDVRESSGKNYSQSVAIPRQDEINGRRVFIQETRKSDNGGKITEKTWLIVEDDVVRMLKTSSYEGDNSTTVTPAKPVILFKRSIAVGDEWNQKTTGKVKITGLVPQVGRYTIDIDVVWESNARVEKRETISDARGAKTYDCMKVVDDTKLRVTKVEVDAPNSGVKAIILRGAPKEGDLLKYKTTTWLGPNVGPVKTEELFELPGQPAGKRTKWLVSMSESRD